MVVELIVFVAKLLRMAAEKEQFEGYGSSNPDTLEKATDHPAGMIAGILLHRRNLENVVNWEQKAGTLSLTYGCIENRC